MTIYRLFLTLGALCIIIYYISQLREHYQMGPANTKQETKEKSIGQYRKGKKLGKGYFGTVYESEKDGQVFALKIANFQQNFDEQKLEAKLMRQLQSEYVVKVYDSFIWNKRFCIVMEKCFCALSKIYDKLSETQIRQLTTQLLHALHFLDSHNILHRDLKLQNILIKDGKIKLSDFGLSKRVQPINTFDKGTTLYMAPQQLRGIHYGKRVDLWAVGVMLLEICFQRRVYQFCTGDSPAGNPDFPSAEDFNAVQDPLIREIIRGLLQRDPKKRPSAAQLIEYLETATVAGQTYKQISLNLAQIHTQIRTLKILQHPLTPTPTLTPTLIPILPLPQSPPYTPTALQALASQLQKFKKLQKLHIEICHDLGLQDAFKVLVEAVNRLERVRKVCIVVNGLKENCIKKENWARGFRVRTQIVQGTWQL